MVYTNKRFEWDATKADLNYRKHGIHFFEAAMAFYDPDAKIEEDLAHSSEVEVRQKLIGKSIYGVICVVFSIRTIEGIVRMISSRKANRKERSRYEKRTKI